MAKEEEVKQTHSLNCDQCGEVFKSPDAFPSPQLCPKCSEPASPMYLDSKGQWKVREPKPDAIECLEVEGVKKILNKHYDCPHYFDTYNGEIAEEICQLLESKPNEDRECEACVAFEMGKEEARIECQQRIERIKREIRVIIKGEFSRAKDIQICLKSLLDAWKEEKI